MVAEIQALDTRAISGESAPINIAFCEDCGTMTNEELEGRYEIVAMIQKKRVGSNVCAESGYALICGRQMAGDEC